MPLPLTRFLFTKPGLKDKSLLTIRHLLDALGQSQSLQGEIAGTIESVAQEAWNQMQPISSPQLFQVLNSIRCLGGMDWLCGELCNSDTIRLFIELGLRGAPCAAEEGDIPLPDHYRGQNVDLARSLLYWLDNWSADEEEGDSPNRKERFE